ncbi:hypothetical protein BZA77DRAFT_301923 [Pyronema omphalodes]|nr:hypothetical protein BZA77DRAFT_301923 [Pyronema omphalodes]
MMVFLYQCLSMFITVVFFVGSSFFIFFFLFLLLLFVSLTSFFTFSFFRFFLSMNDSLSDIFVMGIV